MITEWELAVGEDYSQGRLITLIYVTDRVIYLIEKLLMNWIVVISLSTKCGVSHSLLALEKNNQMFETWENPGWIWMMQLDVKWELCVWLSHD